MSEINPAVFEKLATWWRGLDDDRAGRAILRRAESLTAVTLSAPYQRVYSQLCHAGWKEDAPDYLKDRLAAVIGLLVHVQENSALTPPKAMSARKPGDDKPPVSELRFQRLLESADLESLYSGLRRMLPLMNHSVDVKALAKDVLFWGDNVKKRWAYDYEWPDKSR